MNVLSVMAGSNSFHSLLICNFPSLLCNFELIFLMLHRNANVRFGRPGRIEYLKPKEGLIFLYSFVCPFSQGLLWFSLLFFVVGAVKKTLIFTPDF